MQAKKSKWLQHFIYLFFLDTDPQVQIQERVLKFTLPQLCTNLYSTRILPVATIFFLTTSVSKSPSEVSDPLDHPDSYRWWVCFFFGCKKTSRWFDSVSKAGCSSRIQEKSSKKKTRTFNDSNMMIGSELLQMIHPSCLHPPPPHQPHTSGLIHLPCIWKTRSQKTIFPLKKRDWW